MINDPVNNFDLSFSDCDFTDEDIEEDLDALASGCNFADREVEEDLDSLVSQPLYPRLSILNVTGLDENVADSLAQHLLIVNLPDELSCDVAFKFLVDLNGRVREIALDREASTLKAAAVIEVIQQWLSTWRAPTGVFGTVYLKLRIKP